MGDRDDTVKTARRLQAVRTQQMTLIYAVMVCLFLLILLQFLLLMVAVEGFLGGRWAVLLPATLASGLCFGGACWLIGYVLRIPAEGRR